MPLGRTRRVSASRRVFQALALALLLPVTSCTREQPRDPRAECDDSDAASAGADLNRLEACKTACWTDSGEHCLRLSDRALALSDGGLALAEEGWSRACGAGLATGCKKLVDRLAQDPAQAAKTVSLLAQQCEQGSAPACTRHGVMLADGRGLAPDRPRAQARFRLACDGGEVEGCFWLADSLRQDIAAKARQHAALHDDSSPAAEGLSKAIDTIGQEAYSLFEQACRAGFARACLAGAELGENRSDRELSQELLLLGCAAGDPTACERGAGALAQDRRITRNDFQAIPLYRKACTLGLASSCVRLAEMVLADRGAPRDPQHAVALYSQACDLCEAQACLAAAKLSLNAKGGERDEPATTAYYEKACSLEEPTGCVELGRRFEKGLGVGADLPAAVRAHEKACDAGSNTGCLELGRLYDSGMGVAPDLARSTALYSRACPLGFRHNAEGIVECSGGGRLIGRHRSVPPQVRMGSTTVSGRVDPGIIQLEIRRNLWRVRRCYETALRANPEAQGTVNVEFTITSRGSQDRVSTAGSTFPDGNTISCVLSALREIRVPNVEGGYVTVKYSFQLDRSFLED